MTIRAHFPASGVVSPPPDHMQIGEVAHLTGLTQRTIRYYEELGLLPAPERTQGDFRLYTEKDVRRLTEIARLKELLGLSLGEIKQIVEADEAREQLRGEFHAAGDTPTRIEKLIRFQELTETQISILDRKMAQMSEMKAELEARLGRYREKIAELRVDDATRRQP